MEKKTLSFYATPTPGLNPNTDTDIWATKQIHIQIAALCYTSIVQTGQAKTLLERR